MFSRYCCFIAGDRQRGANYNKPYNWRVDRVQNVTSVGAAATERSAAPRGQTQAPRARLVGRH